MVRGCTSIRTKAFRDATAVDAFPLERGNVGPLQMIVSTPSVWPPDQRRLAVVPSQRFIPNSLHEREDSKYR